MTAALFIASKPITSLYQHLYLVYDPDGSIASSGTYSGDELVLRGGPSAHLSGFIALEGGVPIASSHDGAAGNGGVEPSLTDRNFTLLATGSDATTAWTGMLTWEASLTHDTAVLGTLQNSNINYSLGGNSPDYADTTNSNSTVASALASVGIDIYDNLPIKGGDLDGNGISDTLGTTTRYSVSDVPGVNTRLSGSESNTFDGGEAAHDNLFVDTAGSDGQSGDDTFYGGALGVQVLSNTADGHDTYIYLTPTVQALDWSIIEDGSTPIGLQVDTPDSHT